MDSRQEKERDTVAVSNPTPRLASTSCTEETCKCCSGKLFWTFLKSFTSEYSEQLPSVSVFCTERFLHWEIVLDMSAESLYCANSLSGGTILVLAGNLSEWSKQRRGNRDCFPCQIRTAACQGSKHAIHVTFCRISSSEGLWPKVFDYMASGGDSFVHVLLCIPQPFGKVPKTLLSQLLLVVNRVCLPAVVCLHVK